MLGIAGAHVRVIVTATPDRRPAGFACRPPLQGEGRSPRSRARREPTLPGWRRNSRAALEGSIDVEQRQGERAPRDDAPARRTPGFRRAFWLLALSLVCLAVLSILGMAASEFAQRAATRDLTQAYASLSQVDTLQKQLLATHLAHSSERNRPSHVAFGVGSDFLTEQLQSSLGEARRLVDRPEEAELLSLLEAQILEDSALLMEMKDPAVPVDEAQLDASMERVMETGDRLAELHRQALIDTAVRLRNWTRAVSWLRVAIAVLLLLLAAVFLGMARRFVNALEGLRRAIDQVKTGDLQTRAPPASVSEIQDISVQFNQMTDRLDRARRERAMFVSSVAHDLRTPLFALRSATQLQEKETTIEGVRRRSAVIQRQVDRMDRMMEDLLDASRVEAGNVELRRTRGDLREVVRDCIQLFEGSSEGHAITAALPSEPALAEFDSTRVMQVLVNLLSNAIKYSPEGGAVHVSLERTGEGSLCLSVRDHGVGMSREELSQLFLPFRRFSHDSRIPGVGLGLAVVRRLVEAHDGRIEVESERGVGSTFKVFLPESRRPQSTEQDASTVH